MVGHADVAEAIDVLLDAIIQPLHLGLVLDLLVDQGEAAGQLHAVGQGDLRRLVQAPHAVDHAQGVPVFHVDGQRPDAILDLLGELLRRFAFVIGVGLQMPRLDGDGLGVRTVFEEREL